MAEEKPLAEKGDWVQVWGFVVDADPHPEEYAVRFESHNEHYTGLVRRDHVLASGQVPTFVSRCGSMHRVPSAETVPVLREVYIRCTRYFEHEEKHRADGIEWTDAQAVGDIEV